MTSSPGGRKSDSQWWSGQTSCSNQPAIPHSVTSSDSSTLQEMTRTPKSRDFTSLHGYSQN
eukprot:5703068-Ditylum_brightwellii.AAC.1